MMLQTIVKKKVTSFSITPASQLLCELETTDVQQRASITAHANQCPATKGRRETSLLKIKPSVATI